MATRRDYGSFAKTSARLLAPQVEALGYRQWQDGAFGRAKSGWVEAFFLQQSQWGSGDFCVNIGIDVPGLDEFWAMDRKSNFGLLIAWRLCDSAQENGAERWYHAKDKQQLVNNLKVVATTLAKADPWFQQFQSFSDVVEQYRLRSALPEMPTSDVRPTTALNYGLLLLLDSSNQMAHSWLSMARNLLNRPMYWDAKRRTFSSHEAPGLKLMKPTKDDELRKKVVESALARIQS